MKIAISQRKIILQNPERIEDPVIPADVKALLQL